MAASKQALPQCSPASVGLAQARPSYYTYYIYYKKLHPMMQLKGPA